MQMCNLADVNSQARQLEESVTSLNRELIERNGDALRHENKALKDALPTSQYNQR